VIDYPTLSSQQNMNAFYAIPYACLGDLTDALALGTVISRMSNIKIRGLAQLQHRRRPPYAHSIRLN